MNLKDRTYIKSNMKDEDIGTHIVDMSKDELIWTLFHERKYERKRYWTGIVHGIIAGVLLVGLIYGLFVT